MTDTATDPYAVAFAEDAANAAHEAATAAYDAAFRAALRNVDPESIARVERAATAAARLSVDARIKASAARLSAVTHMGVPDTVRDRAAELAREAATAAYNASGTAWDSAYHILNSGVSA
jgi:hypothetical protein